MLDKIIPICYNISTKKQGALMKKAIYFDMDGTIANLYAVKNWLPMLQASNPAPYKQAKVMLNMSLLARTLNKLQKQGYHIGIISWLSKQSTKEYDKEVTQAKKEWLGKHLKSVAFNEIKIVPYGTPKSQVAQYKQGILFDDERNNRQEWKGKAYAETNILKILYELAENPC